MTYAAVFSCDAGVPAGIHVSPANDLYETIASVHLSAGDNPLRALKALGFRLADPAARYRFARTMADTGYQNVPVTRIG